MAATPIEELVAKMTVAELARATGFSVSELVALVLEDAGGLANKLPSGASVTPTPPAEPAVETRTQRGRDALDAAILAVLRESKQPLRALEVREHVGGTAAQVRGRLNALLQEERIGSRGQASGTKYFYKK